MKISQELRDEAVVGIPPDIEPTNLMNTSLEDCIYDIKNALTVPILMNN